MKKRQKKELTVAGLTVLFTVYVSKRFDKDAFIAGEEDGEETYQKYLRNIPMEKVTVRAVCMGEGSVRETGGHAHLRG